MRNRIKEALVSLVITAAIFILLEILSSTIFPFWGVVKYRIPFNVLLVLYMGFKLRTPYIAPLILTVQYIHSFFSVEGWAPGTMVGICVCIIISYFKDIIHLSSKVVTIIVIQAFQFVWFVLMSLLIYIKVNDFSLIAERFWKFIPESIAVSVLAPFLFVLLDRVWNVGSEDILRD